MAGVCEFDPLCDSAAKNIATMYFTIWRSSPRATFLHAQPSIYQRYSTSP